MARHREGIFSVQKMPHDGFLRDDSSEAQKAGYNDGGEVNRRLRPLIDPRRSTSITTILGSEKTPDMSGLPILEFWIGIQHAANLISSGMDIGLLRETAEMHIERERRRIRDRKEAEAMIELAFKQWEQK